MQRLESHSRCAEGPAEAPSVRGASDHSRHAIFAVVVILLWASVGLTMPARAGEAEARSAENTLKAAFLYHFMSFVTWPDAAFDGVDDAFDIAVLGPDPFGVLLEEALGEADGEGRPFRFHRVMDVKGLKGAHMLFVSREFEGDLERVLRSLAGQPFLTVSDREHFAAEGGMIGMFVEDGRLRFEVNRSAVERADLSMSSRMLVLAKIVGDED